MGFSDRDHRPNVLFLFSDEHSFRCFSHLDAEETGEPVRTPTLDELAHSSTRFANAYCQMPLCTPSRLCTLTGQRVPSAGAWTNGAPLLPDRTTVAETLSEAEFTTCLQGKMHLAGPRQFAGFDHRPYGDLTGERGHQHDPIMPPDAGRGEVLGTRIADAGITEIPESQLQERRVAEETVSFVREHEHRSDDPWFVCASFSRPHFPLTAPSRHFERYWNDGPTDRLTDPKVGVEGDAADHPVREAIEEGFQVNEFDERKQLRARAGYFACVDWLDEIVGDLLGTLEREGHLENTIVVYASDHGELAGEHGLWWKHSWHEASTRVPLLIQTPAQRNGQQPPQRVTTPVGLIDLFPTVCGFADVDPPCAVAGTDLSSAIETCTEPDRGPVVSDNLIDRWGEGTEFRVVRDGRYKFVRFRADEFPDLLFDVEADPLETENLARDPMGSDATALKRLRTYVDETLDFAAAERQRLADAEAAETLTLDVREPTPSGNLIQLPDGRIVDADTPLYDPDEIVPNPAETFDDWPGE